MSAASARPAAHAGRLPSRQDSPAAAEQSFELKDKTKGLSVFLVDLRDIKGKLDVKPLDMMINHHTNILFFENVEVPEEHLRLIEERLREHERDPGGVITLAELKRRVKRNLTRKRAK